MFCHVLLPKSHVMTWFVDGPILKKLKDLDHCQGKQCQGFLIYNIRALKMYEYMCKYVKTCNS